MAVENINPEKEPVPAGWVPRVIRGGKDGDPPDPPAKNWLEELEIGTVFVTSPKNQYQAFLFEVIFKGELFTLLKQLDGPDMYVNNHHWCLVNKDYEVLGINPPDRGGNNE